MNPTETSPENRYTDYDPWAWLYNKSEAHLAAARVFPLIEKLLIPKLGSNAKIFDLCCGTGQLSQELLTRGYQVIGLDGSEQMLSYARQNAPNGEFILGDARSFQIEPKSFNAAICTDSALNHMMNLEDLKLVFQNIYNILQDDGLFLFDLGLENRYSNIAIADGEMQENYAWTVGETYDSTSNLGSFTITMFQPNEEQIGKKSNLFRSISYSFKRLIYNKFFRNINPAKLLDLVEKDWQSSKIDFSVRPHAKAEICSLLTEVGFTSFEIYDSSGQLAKPQEARDACFLARKLAALS
ncbi:MAG: class I SAM-dependent methyltransferase [Cyanobacteria bacterium P01_F01_bin.143]